MNNGSSESIGTAYLYSKRGVAMNKAESVARWGRYKKVDVVAVVVTVAEEG
jgi:hypothetical protein